MPKTVRNLERNTLRKIAASKNATALQKELAALRIAYSEDQKLLTGSINQLIGQLRIYPRHYPGQASGRTSTIDPPITNWPRACCNQHCQRRLHSDSYFAGILGYIEHEWTDQCWSIRDIQLPDDDEILTVHDHHNIEGKIHDIILDDKEAIEAHLEGYDLHTITFCNIFGMEYPKDLRNPHTSDVDAGWREQCRLKGFPWQGKDTRYRVLAKNFNHGSKYARNERFVYAINGIEKYGISYTQLRDLARRYIESKGSAWKRKLALMDAIRYKREARSLYGFRRLFFDSSEETGKEGFSHMISGTVSDYNNHTIALIDEWLGDNVRLLHNAHDGDKFAIKKHIFTSGVHEKYPHHKEYNAKMDLFKMDIRGLIERPIAYQGRSLIMTAGIKVYGGSEDDDHRV